MGAEMMLRGLATGALGLVFLPLLAAASAQTPRIGLAEDSDLFDPTVAHTYIGRIVFASLCDDRGGSAAASRPAM